MAFTSGTATDYIDLADKFRSWITGTAGWTQLAWTPGDVATGGMLLCLRGPGADVDKRVFVNIRSVFSDSDAAYAWDIRGATAYDGSKGFGLQDGESTATYLALWKNTISYWFYANDRRFIVVAKINTVYVSAYAGFGLPWATPAEYPFPLYIAATDGMLRSYNATDADHTSCVDPGGTYDSVTNTNSGKYRRNDGVWRRIVNRGTGASNDRPGILSASSDAAAVVLPYSTAVYVSTASNTGITSTANYWRALSSAGTVDDGGLVNRLVATAQGERVLLPVTVIDRFEPAGAMALDGVYFPCGAGLTPEQTASFSGRNFRAFCNVHRTSSNDFFVIEEN